MGDMARGSAQATLTWWMRTPDPPGACAEGRGPGLRRAEAQSCVQPGAWAPHHATPGRAHPQGRCPCPERAPGPGRPAHPSLRVCWSQWRPLLCPLVPIGWGLVHWVGGASVCGNVSPAL